VSLVASDGNYVRLHWRGHASMLERSLPSLEARLDPRRFFRANRQQIIQLDFVECRSAPASAVGCTRKFAVDRRWKSRVGRRGCSETASAPDRESLRPILLLPVMSAGHS
jgi:hypothetical protein